MNYLLAIDQGTSSTRAMLYNDRGELAASSQYVLTQYYPHPGWVEHDPEEIWTKTKMAIADVLNQVKGHTILTCGIANQRETTLIWNKITGECLSPAIVWQDRRTQVFCNALHDYKTTIQQKTGLLPDPYFSATKLHWLLTNIPEARSLLQKDALAFGTIDSFLIWRLTKGRSHLTDVTNASRTLLFNIHDLSWDETLLNLFNIPRSILPDVCASDAYFGDIDETYFGYPIPINGVAGDQQAGLIGQRCFSEGMTKATFGTGGFLFMNTGKKAVISKNNLLTTIAYSIKGETCYGLEGSIYHAGTTIKWLRDEMKLIQDAAETEILARSLKSNEGVYLVSSFTGLGAPYWLSKPGAAIVGLSQKTNRAHFARAALEGVCYQTREVLHSMCEDSQVNLSLLRVDGGMVANRWFLQFLSSQCRVLVQHPQDIEITAQGVACLAAVGIGLYDSLASLLQGWVCESEYRPSDNKNSIERDFQGWTQALQMIKAKEGLK